MTATIHHGDCLDVLRGMPDNSVDAVVCDPPYGLSNTSPDKVTETIVRWAQGDHEYVPQGRGFMGASWDAFVPPVAVWDECLRVLKPGGHLVAFAGSRTQDLMGLAIRLAGFDIRENLAWLYGSGFPKSLDISKAIDKMGGDPLAFRRFAKAYAEAVKVSEFTHTDIDRHLGIKSSSCYWAREDHRGGMPPRHHWEQVRDLLGLADDLERLYDEAEREVIGKSAHKSGIGNATAGHYTVGGTKAEAYDITAPSSDAAKQWSGWGTALKPAHEPIILARKPFQGTVAANTLTWGTGGLNIDATRIGTSGGTRATNLGELRGTMYDRGKGKPTNDIEPTNAGRWPANVVLDPDTAKALDQQSGNSACRPAKAALSGEGSGKGYAANASSYATNGTAAVGYTDEGGASRFFKVVEPDVPFMYAAKAPKRERPSYTTEDGQTVQHSTVKPLSIMQWLVKLVTPEGGTVLDPFAGSGTTVEAAILEGFHVIGIEREEAYLPLIQQRIDRANDVLPMAS